jgi:excinuclease ABC subunit C
MKRDNIDFKALPDEPGVYRFVGEKKEVLYVGKATSLRDRVKSYFATDIAEVRSPLIEKVVRDAVKIEWEECDSVLDALILEAKRIREFDPPGNTDLKDNKSWNYLVVTNEDYPRILMVRERVLTETFSPKLIKHLFGPFPNGSALKEALRIVRRIFPFFDTTFPIATPRSDLKNGAKGRTLSRSQEKTVRFNQSIGKYPEFSKTDYKKTVNYIVLLFEAKKKTLLTTIERDMKRAAKDERFEDAAVLRRQLFALQHIQDVTLIKEDLKRPDSAEFRIEAYDTAHIRGDSPRGVMAVVVDGEAVPAEYRTFTIRSAKPGDDYAALDEIIARRARHSEWPLPSLVVIDGGRVHLTRGKKALKEAGIDVDVVAVVKDERHKPKEVLGPSALVHAHESSILLANSEAHRFAIGRHRRALRKRPA